MAKAKPEPGPYDDWTDEQHGAFAGFAKMLDRYFDERAVDDEEDEAEEAPEKTPEDAPRSAPLFERSLSELFGKKK